ncbi:MAG: hypothetical protein ABEJ48_05615 [Halobacteriales archaeon]
MRMRRGVLIGILLVAAVTTGVDARTDPQPSAEQSPPAPATQQTPMNETNWTVINQTAPNYRLNNTGNSTYVIRIGNGTGRMVTVLNLSLFGNLPNAGAFRFRSYGFVNGTRIVAVEIGIAFEGIGDLWSFFTNPFSRFGIEAQTSLRLPFLNTEQTDRTNDRR